MKNDWRSRLLDRATELNLDMKAVSKKAGKGETFFRDIIKRDRVPAIDGFRAVCKALNLDPDWVMTGDEPTEPQRRERNDTEDAAYDEANYRPKMAGMLPELDGQLGAGEGKEGEVLNLDLGGETISGHRIVADWLFPETWLRTEINASVSKTIVMPVTGDSMEPTYRPGDRVLVDRSQNRLLSDSVYVISDGESAPKIKRLVEVMFSKPRMVNIVSDNPAIADQPVKVDELIILGRVVGVVARR